MKKRKKRSRAELRHIHAVSIRRKTHYRFKQLVLCITIRNGTLPVYFMIGSRNVVLSEYESKDNHSSIFLGSRLLTVFGSDKPKKVTIIKHQQPVPLSKLVDTY